MPYSLDEKMHIDTELYGNPDEYIDDLKQLAGALSVRTSDIAELTSWGPVRTSKIINKRQRASVSDLKLFARVLGRLFHSDKTNEDNLKLIISKTEDGVRECLSSVFRFHSADRIDQEFDVLNYELPVAVINLLGLNPTEYMVDVHMFTEEKTKMTYESLNGKGEYYDRGVCVQFAHRNLDEKEAFQSSFGIMMSSDRENLFFFVKNRRNAKESRKMDMDETLNLKVKDKIMFEKMMSKYIEEYERSDYSIIAEDVNNQEVSFEGYISDVFFCYSRIINEKYRFDISTRAFRRSKKGIEYYNIDLNQKLSEISPELIARGETVLAETLKKVGSDKVDDSSKIILQHTFSDDVSGAVRKKNGYVCEMGDHKSFVGNDGNPYVDVIPIVPSGLCKEIGAKGFVEENAACLCPNCAAKYKFGDTSDRAEMVLKLYKTHEAGLKKRGINVTIGQLFTSMGI